MDVSEADCYGRGGTIGQGKISLTFGCDALWRVQVGRCEEEEGEEGVEPTRRPCPEWGSGRA